MGGKVIVEEAAGPLAAVAGHVELAAEETSLAATHP